MKRPVLITLFFCVAATSRCQTIPPFTYVDDEKTFEKSGYPTDGLPVCDSPSGPSGGTTCSYRRPFPAAYHNYLWREKAPLAAWNPLPEYGWMPLSDVMRGREEAEELTALATERKPIGCLEQNKSCEGIVPYNSSEKDGPKGLALCLMERTVKLAIVPRVCSPVLINSSPEPLLLAITGYQYTQYEPINNGMFSVLILERPLGPVKKVADLLLATMKNTPLNLDEGQNLIIGSQGALIEAAAGPRRSTVMSDFNEIITVHADILVMGDKPKEQYLGISTSVSVLLNRQNTDKPTDWHPLPWTDFDKYHDWVASTILAKMQAYCDPHFVDFHTIVCGPHRKDSR